MEIRLALALLASCTLSLACLGQTRPNIEWGEKFNSPGATMIVKETGRTRLNGQTVITYNLFVTGLPKDADYVLWTRLAGMAPRTVADAFLNKDGLVVNVLADPAHNVAEDPINLKVVAGRGEPKQFALVSDDAKYRVFGQVVPFPIAKTSGTCGISATMMGPDYSGVLIVVTGLPVKEEFQIHTRSGNEGGDSKATATGDGSYTALVFPSVKGQPSGTLKYGVVAKSCSVDIEVPWGQGSYAIQ